VTRPPRVSLAAIRSLDAIAVAGTFAAAARSLSLTQSALSQRIATLECSIGVELVNRSRTPVTLTEAGRVYLSDALRALEAFHSGLREIKGSDRVREVNIAVTLTTEGQIVEELLARASERLPSVTINTRLLWTSEVSDAVLAGKVDLAFARHPAWWGDLRVEHLWDTPLVLTVPLEHKFAGRTSISLRDLANEPLSVVPRALSPGSYDVVEAAFLSAGVLPRLVNSPVLAARARDLDSRTHIGSVGPKLAPGEQSVDLISIDIDERPAIGLHMVSRHSDQGRMDVAALTQVAREIAHERRTR